MIPNAFTKFKREDLWIAAFNDIQSVPMWTGWTTWKHTEMSPQQPVCLYEAHTATSYQS